MLKFITIAALLATTPAVAHAADGNQTWTVRTDDLDLTSAAGIARLDQRVETAARSMCWSGSRGIVAANAEAACRAEVIENSRRTVALAVAKARRDMRLANAASALPGA